MPLDYRRFNGPEDSVSYKEYSHDYSKNSTELYNELVNENGKRKDGRALDEARSLFAKTSTVSQAKGSSFLELKKTKVVCSVFDPREIVHQSEFSSLGQIFCEVKFAPFSCPRKRRPHAPDAEEKALSVALKKALAPAVCRHLFPNFQIDVFIYILEHDGCCLAAAIDAAGLALADAGVPMYDIIIASTVAVIDDKIFVDPSEAEEHLALRSTDNATNHGLITMSMLPNLIQIADFRQIGAMDVDCITRATEFLEKGCENIVKNIQQIIVLKVLHSFKLQKKLEDEAKAREAILDARVEEWKAKLNCG